MPRKICSRGKRAKGPREKGLFLIPLFPVSPFSRLPDLALFCPIPDTPSVFSITCWLCFVSKTVESSDCSRASTSSSDSRALPRALGRAVWRSLPSGNDLGNNKRRVFRHAREDVLTRRKAFILRRGREPFLRE